MATDAKDSATNVVRQPDMTECLIAKLAVKDLAAIFKYLPSFERLIVSAVCTKWRDISQTPWRDISHLDLSQVPTQNIHAVIKKCPNLVSVSGLRQSLGDLGRFASRLSNLTSLSCVDCTFTIDAGLTLLTDLDASLRSTSWEELIWHNARTLLLERDMLRREFPLPYAIPATLRRLQASALSIPEYAILDIRGVLRAVPLLECFILAGLRFRPERDGFCRFFFSRTVHSAIVEMCANLRELYLETPICYRLNDLVSALPQLSVLFLNCVAFDGADVQLQRVVTQHRSLRILVITAYMRSSSLHAEVLIPVRKLFPSGFNAPPVPQLHLFLGKIAAARLRFHPSTTDALKIHPIDAPLPEFLEKAEIKPIFEGSWIASRIREGARDGVNLTDYSFEGKAESILFVLGD